MTSNQLFNIRIVAPINQTHIIWFTSVTVNMDEWTSGGSAASSQSSRGQDKNKETERSAADKEPGTVPVEQQLNQCNKKI